MIHAFMILPGLYLAAAFELIRGLIHAFTI